jgi:Flp pilus assembly secretin CpaC
MRRLAPHSLVLALAIAASPVVSLAASLGVPLDQAMIIALPAAAKDVVVGNPNIADVSISDQRHLIITGKMGGVTNLVVDDAAGRVIFNRQIVVGASSGDRVEVMRGAQVYSYACAPVCQQVAVSGSSASAGGGSGAGGGAGSPAAPPPPAGPVTASPTTP